MRVPCPRPPCESSWGGGGFEPADLWARSVCPSAALGITRGEITRQLMPPFFLFQLMSFNTEVSADAFQVLWEISARQLASAG